MITGRYQLLSKEKKNASIACTGVLPAKSKKKKNNNSKKINKWHSLFIDS